MFALRDFDLCSFPPLWGTHFPPGLSSASLLFPFCVEEASFTSLAHSVRSSHGLFCLFGLQYPSALGALLPRFLLFAT